MTTTVTRDIADQILETLDGYTTLETPQCVWCGKTGTLVLTADEVADLEAGAFIQDAASRLPRAQREQFISGTHPQCWEENLGEW